MKEETLCVFYKECIYAYKTNINLVSFNIYYYKQDIDRECKLENRRTIKKQASWHSKLFFSGKKNQFFYYYY